MTVLILAGTTEARALCADLADSDIPAIASLAGVTESPLPHGVPTRSGGFGGADALARWLQDNAVSAVIDATHPFAAKMPWNAAKACARANIPRTRLLRPAWPVRSHWTLVDTLQEAAARLPPGARALLTTGSGSAGAFASREDTTCWLRSIEPVRDLAGHIRPLIARPPFSLEQELALMRDLGATHLVTRNAGGSGTAKLDAADALDIETIVVNRPATPPGPTIETVDAALAWLHRNVAKAL